MQSHICCPECGSREVRASVDIKNAKRSMPIYIRRHCKACGAEFIEPDEYRRAVNDIQVESRKIFKAILSICLAVLAFSALLLLNRLAGGVEARDIIIIACLGAAAILGMISAVAIRLEAHRRMFRLESEMETVSMQIDSHF